MATFTAGPGAGAGIDFATFDIADLAAGDNPTIHDSKHYKLEVDATHYSEFFGTGFTYNTDFDLIGGTLNEIVAVDVTEVYRVSGLSMSVATASKFVDKNDSQGFLAAIFAGADSITGSAVADNLLGFNGNDTIDGVGGNDTLNGGIGNDSLIGGVGNDSMDGAAGNDTYDVDSTTDLASESVAGAAGGTDTVRSSAAIYTLGDNIENLILTGTADIDGTGNALANTITGNTGENELSGDAGKDKLVGGDGNDTLSGGADNDTLDGGSGNDSLDGGSGADSMAGGAGNDSYKVDSLTDKVTETLANDKNGGEDTVLSSAASFVLGLNVDHLQLIDKGLNGTGNALNNMLTGNGEKNSLSGLAGADTIDGGAGDDTLDGGTGNDTMDGGEGNDFYIQDSLGDLVNPDSGSSIGDELKTNQLLDKSITGIENYTFTGTKSVTFTAEGDVDNIIKGTSAADAFLAGLGNDSVAGLAGNDSLVGDAGNDTLDGGAGIDTMNGGGGDDTYTIDNVKDVIADISGTDTVRSSVSLNLGLFGSNIENAELTGTGALNLTGDDAANKLVGNAGANKIDGGKNADDMAGGKGNDTYTVDNLGDKVTENLGEGTDLVLSSVDFKLGDNFENLTLTLADNVNGTGNTVANLIIGNSGKNVLTGLDGNDTLTGNDGNDTLDGGIGLDRMTGGKGDDLYFVDNAKDTVTESATLATGGGVDTVKSTITFTLGANLDNLQLLDGTNANGTGNAIANALTGNSSENKLTGLAGNDSLVGGDGKDTLDGGTGNDTMDGGEGNDFYIQDSLGDLVNPDSGSSIGDELKTNQLLDKSITGIENYTFIGTKSVTFTAEGDVDNIIKGTSAADAFLAGLGNDSVAGLAGNDSLVGDAGNDTLDGGAGIDTMNGGGGDDTYTIDNVKDVIADISGTDTVRSSVSLNLGLFGSNIENAELTGTGALNLTGDDAANKLVGNAGANKIDGGKNADDMAGGKGNDTYTVDNLGDKVTENLGEGTDLVLSSVDFKLGDNFENLTLTLADNVNGTGNTVANLIIGNSGKNVLTGLDGNDTLTGNDGNDTLDGGIGLDRMTGGKGDDLYFVDNAKDTVTESATLATGGGVDTVKSTITFTLGANLDNLQLLDGTNANGTGNAIANALTGNSSENKLTGLAGNDSLVGGDGKDTLDGGTGNDTMDGGEGNDFYIQDSLGDLVNPDSGSSIGDELKTNQLLDKSITGIENYTFIGTKSVTFTAEGDVDNIIKGTSAADELTGGLGNDTLDGGSGDDTMIGGEGDDIVNGGLGFNSLEYLSSSDGVTVDLRIQGGVTAQTISASQGKDVISNISDVYGSLFDDTLIGSGTDNILFSRDGNDRLVILDADFLAADGGAGTDRLVVNGANVSITQQDVFKKLFGIEEIDLTGTGANHLTLIALDVLQTSNTDVMRILGDSGDSVNSTLQGWSKGLDQLIDGQNYHTYTAAISGTTDTATLLVDADITQTIT